MSSEQEDGEIVEHLDLDAIRRMSTPNNSKSTIIELRPLSARKNPTIEETLHGAVTQYMEQATATQGPSVAVPILPIVPIDHFKVYYWKSWEEWYQTLIEVEKQPLSNGMEKRFFSLLLSHSPRAPFTYACMVTSNGQKIFEYRVQWPNNLSFPPQLEGISFDTCVSLVDFQQFRGDLLSNLDCHGDSAMQVVLLVHGLNSDILKSFNIDSLTSVFIRDINRFPLQKQSFHIAGIVHDLFINPSTEITLLNPEQLLEEYIKPLHLTVKWLDIPMNCQPTLKWVRFDLFQGNQCCVMGYCIALKSDKTRRREAFALLHQLWGDMTPCLFYGPPSEQEKIILERFIQCAFKRTTQSFQEAASMLIHIYQCNKREFEFSLRSMMNKCLHMEKSNASLKREQPLSPTMPAVSPIMPSSSITPTSQITPTSRLSPTSHITPTTPPSSSTAPPPNVTVLPALNNRAEVKFLEGKKLILIIDLDMTLVHAIHEEESMGLFLNWLHGASESNAEDEWKQTLKNQIHSIELHYVDEGGSARMSKLLIKIRPGVREMLQMLANTYEMMVYTQGESQYAERVMQILDPGNVIFKKRYIARGDTRAEPQKKLLSKIMDCWNQYVRKQNVYDPTVVHTETLSEFTLEELCHRLLILDDKEDVWGLHEEKGNVFDPTSSLIKCFPYMFFDTKTDLYDFDKLSAYEKVEIEYIHRLGEIFQELHQKYAMESLPDVRNTLRMQKHNVFHGLHIAFTSILELSETVENNVLYRSLVEFGGVYMPKVTEECDLLICRQVRTQKVNQAQQLQIPVVSVRWLEECVKYWKLTPLDMFYMDFAQDLQQTPLFGKVDIDDYHNLTRLQADTRLFTVTRPPRAFGIEAKTDLVVMKDFDDIVRQDMEFNEKRQKSSAQPSSPLAKQFSPLVNVTFNHPCSLCN